MPLTLNRLNKIRTEGSSIDDTLDPLDHDANAESAKDDLDHVCSQLRILSGKPRWEDPVDASISELVVQIEPERDSYTELTYTGDNLTGVDVWTSDAKTLKISESTLTYVGDDLTQTVKLIYDTDGFTLLATITKTLTYDVDGNLETITSVRT